MVSRSVVTAFQMVARAVSKQALCVNIATYIPHLAYDPLRTAAMMKKAGHFFGMSLMHKHSNSFF